MKLYQEIYDEIKDKIAKGELKSGAKLPSIRTLSSMYDCSNGTVLKALDQLCANHIIFAKPQSGYFVIENVMAENDLKGGYKLDTGNSFVNSLSTVDLKHCLNLATQAYANHTLDVDLKGIDSLSEALSPYLADMGVYTKDSNIYPILGITQIISLLTLSPFPNGKKSILVEEPSYSYYLDFLKSQNIKPLVIRRDENGIDLKELRHHFKYNNVKFFFTIPRNHNPLGTVYSYKQRKQIMELALKYDVYIIENDYFGNAHQLPKYVPIHFFSYQEKCIYLRSYSKELPFLRIGLAVVPKSLEDTFNQLSLKSFYYSYHIPALISQATLEAYIRAAIYKKHTLKMHQSINKNIHTIKKVTANWRPEFIKVIGGKSGYYCSLQINKKINIENFVMGLERKRVFLKSNKDMFYYKENYDNSVRISHSKTNPKHLEEALDIIYSEVERILG